MTAAALTALGNCTQTADLVTPPAERLDTKVYGELKKVLEAAGGTWNTKRGAFTFSRDPRPQLAEVLSVGKVISTKKATQAFYTPAALVLRVLAYAPTLAELSVLEPSAGEGAFADVLAERGADVVCVELDSESAAVLAKKHTVIEGDFLECAVSPAGHDLVVMNPPFAKGQDMQHVAHAFKFLKPGGTLLAIMGTHFTFAASAAAKSFRAFVAANGAVLEEFEAGAFKESGTAVPTVLVKLTR